MTQVAFAALESVPLFAGLSEEELRHVAGAVEPVSVAPGETVLAQGNSSQQLWILLEGTCQVVRQAANGKGASLELATLEPYSNFGEMSFFHAAPHSASVRAKTSVQLLRLKRDDFDRLICQHSGTACRLSINVVNSLADRLRRMDEWIVELSERPAPGLSELNRFREKVFKDWTL